MQRPKIIIGLMIFFVYTTYREGMKLFTPTADPGYYLSAALDWGQLYSALTVIQIILLGASSCFLIWPRPMGFWVVMSTILFMVVRGAFTGYLATLDSESTMIALEEAFRAKGRELTPEHMELMGDMNFLVIGMGFGMVFSAVLAVLTIIRRNYFWQSESSVY